MKFTKSWVLSALAAIAICHLPSPAPAASVVMTGPGSFTNPSVVTSFNATLNGLAPLQYGAGDRKIVLTGSPGLSANGFNLFTTGNSFSDAANITMTETFDFTGIASENNYAIGLFMEKFNNAPSTSYLLTIFDHAGTSPIGSQSINNVTNSNVFFMGLGSDQPIGKATLQVTSFDDNNFALRTDSLFDGVHVQNTPVAVPEPATVLLATTGLAALFFMRRRINK